jgi:hypothetical protein
MDFDLWVVVPALVLFFVVNAAFGWAVLLGMVG